jgi:hypothetical protein
MKRGSSRRLVPGGKVAAAFPMVLPSTRLAAAAGRKNMCYTLVGFF